MVKPKIIIIAVCVGFLLSLLTGIITGVSFGMVLLRAVFFGVLFGLLSFGLGFVFQKFLLDTPDGSDGLDTHGSSSLGSVVDLSVGDEPLLEEGSGPDFYVRSDILDDGLSSDSSKEEKKSPSRSVAIGVQPEKLVGEESVPVGEEQFTPVSLVPPPSNAVVLERADSSDSLPDIGELAVATDSEGQEDDAAVISFPDGSEKVSRKSKRNMDSLSDSQTIAQALRTVLAKDS